MESAASRRARDLAQRWTRIASLLERDDISNERRAELETRVSAGALALTSMGDRGPALYRRDQLYALLQLAIEQGQDIAKAEKIEPELVAAAEADMLVDIVSESDPELGARLARVRDRVVETLDASIRYRGGRGNRVRVTRRDRFEALFAALGMGASRETLRR